VYKVLVVDDERLIREGISKLILWENFGFSIAGLASNGFEGLELYESCKPQVVLVDIKMPEMDGFQLIREIKNKNPACHIIILSGHTDFEYAQKAIYWKVDGYLRKPVDEEELILSLKKIHEELELRKLQQDMKNSKEFKDKHTPAELESLLRELLLPGNRDAKEVLKLLEKHLNWPSYQVMVAEVSGPDNYPTWSSALVKDKLNKELQARQAGCAVLLDSRIALILSQGYSNQKHLDQLYHFLKHLLQDLTKNFLAAIGPLVTQKEQLTYSCYQALDFLKYAFFSEPDKIIAQIPEICLPGNAELSLQQEEQGDLVDKLVLIMHSGNYEQTMKLLDELIYQEIQSGSSAQDLKNLILKLLNTSLNRLLANNRTVWGDAQGVLDWISLAYNLPSLYEFRLVIEHNLSRIIEQDSGGGSAGLVRKMMELIRKNYYKNLKLETLSEIFNYNSAYLGKLFKQYTGEHFHVYLDKIRIENAKALLEQGIKVYVVAERVGYSYVDYFHGKFRKYTGMSPSEYKNHLKKSPQKDFS